MRRRTRPAKPMAEQGAGRSRLAAGRRKIAAIGTAPAMLMAVAADRPLRDVSEPGRNAPTSAASQSVEQTSVVHAKAYNLTAAEHAELDLNLDSLLKSPGVDPDAPFDERRSTVANPRILDTMREIDKTLGGGVRWPRVHVTPGLNRGTDPALARYTWGWGGERASIHLDEDWVYAEHASGEPDSKSIRQVLVHELQRDNARPDRRAAGGGRGRRGTVLGPFRIQRRAGGHGEGPVRRARPASRRRRRAAQPARPHRTARGRARDRQPAPDADRPQRPVRRRDRRPAAVRGGPQGGLHRTPHGGTESGST